MDMVKAHKGHVYARTPHTEGSPVFQTRQGAFALGELQLQTIIQSTLMTEKFPFPLCP